MELKERIEKFNTFLTNFEEASGATGLCEAVRSAVKVCFEGLGDYPAWADTSLLDPKYKDNVVAGAGTIHRTVFHDNPLAKFKARKMAKKAAEKEIPATDPVGTDAPKDECAENPE
jgi:hypothetical protein